MGWLKKAWYWPRKHKQHAEKYWPEKAGREYDKGHALMKRPDAASKFLGALHKSNALAYYGAGAAAGLASESVGGWVLDLASMGRGKLVTMGAGAAARALGKLAKPAGTAARTLGTAGKLARQYSQPGSALYRGRKAVKLGTVAARRGTAGAGPAEPAPGYQPPHREPFEPIAPQIRPDLPRSRPIRPSARPRARTPGPATTPSARPERPRFSVIDPVKLADMQLRHSRPATPRPLGGGPFSSTTDRLRDYERRLGEQERSQAWLRGVQRSLERGIKVPSIHERQRMESRFGVGRPGQPAHPAPGAGHHARPLASYARGLR
ncbi:hypothetical protein SH611_06170 [Geminicoccaceae bacterium 1502E]|nr:hypothetical protein [Geminicoccaceae bacterium 1502E]